MKENDRRAIERAAHVLKRELPVERVILFGSKARGTADAESDIDVLLLTRTPLSWSDRWRIVELLYDIQLDENVVISTVDVPSEEWTDGIYSVLPLHDEVEREGVVT